MRVVKNFLTTAILLTILLTPGKWSYAALTDDQVLYWAFDDNLDDSDDGNHDGTLNEMGTDYAYADGKVSRCLNFNSGDAVSVSDFSGLDGQTNFTDCAWVKRDDTSANGYWFAKFDFVEAQIDANGEFKVTLYDSDGTTSAVETVDDAAENTNWHHICVTHNGTVVKLYVDGTEADSDTPASWSGTLANNSGQVLVGYQANANVDEVRLWSRVLSTSEIGELAGSATPTPTNTATVTNTRLPGGSQSVILLDE